MVSQKKYNEANVVYKLAISPVFTRQDWHLTPCSLNRYKLWKREQKRFWYNRSFSIFLGHPVKVKMATKDFSIHSWTNEKHFVLWTLLNKSQWSLEVTPKSDTYRGQYLKNDLKVKNVLCWYTFLLIWLWKFLNCCISVFADLF